MSHTETIPSASIQVESKTNPSHPQPVCLVDLADLKDLEVVKASAPFHLHDVNPLPVEMMFLDPVNLAGLAASDLPVDPVSLPTSEGLVEVRGITLADNVDTQTYNLIPNEVSR